MRIFTREDFIDIYTKGKQRGIDFLFSKLKISQLDRTRSAFNDTRDLTSNAWEIPYLTDRWNKLTTGNKNTDFEDFFMNEFLLKSNDLKVISLGSGGCDRELKLATYPQFSEITCVDIVPENLNAAKARITEEHKAQMIFLCESIYDLHMPKESYDVVFFYASLHHFKNVEQLINDTIIPALKPGGLIIINEFVGADRLQFPKKQLVAVNKSLAHIPKKWRVRRATTLVKNKFYGCGLLRMIVADPSECVDSSNIVPSLHNNLNVVFEKGYGGNLTINVLKDIAHHFVELNEEKKKILDKLFQLEDEYLLTERSDFVCGIYQKKASH